MAVTDRDELCEVQCHSAKHCNHRAAPSGRRRPSALASERLLPSRYARRPLEHVALHAVKFGGTRASFCTPRLAENAAQMSVIAAGVASALFTSEHRVAAPLWPASWAGPVQKREHCSMLVAR